MTQDNRIGILVENFNKICRLCCKTSDSLISIYKTTNENADNRTAEMLLDTLGLSVNRDDGLPESLCPDCNEKLRTSNKFWKQCHSSAEYLQEILIKHEEYLLIKSETPNDDDRNFDDGRNFDDAYLVIEYLDDLSPDADMKVKELHPSQENETEQIEAVETKRKRGRPKTVVDTPPISSELKNKSVGHKRKKSEIRKDICLVCGKIVNHNIKGHQAIHDTSNLYKCDICGFQTYVKLYLKNHMKKKHIAQRQYPCPHCHLVFMHTITLKRHATIHSGEKNHVCEECGKSYRQRDMLTAHRKRHLPPTIQCSFCDKLFYSKNELKSHVGLHTGIKAFKCDICSAAFVASSSLAAHRRQHRRDNVLPSCKICDMMFVDRLTYNMHLMDHQRLNQSIAYNKR